MVFYFSATGNSKYVAERIGREFGGQVINISDATRNNEYKYQVEDEEKVFFIFPVYFYGLPNLVSAFIKNYSLLAETPDVCGIGTYGGSCGAVDRMFKSSIERQRSAF